MKTTMLVPLSLAVLTWAWTACGSASETAEEAEKQRQFESSPEVKRKQREAARKAIEGTTEAMQDFGLPAGDKIRRSTKTEGWLTKEEVRKRAGWTDREIDRLVREGRLRPGGRHEEGRLSVMVYDPDEVDRLLRETQGQEDER